jgi:hypothetical protein
LVFEDIVTSIDEMTEGLDSFSCVVFVKMTSLIILSVESFGHEVDVVNEATTFGFPPSSGDDTRTSAQGGRGERRGGREEEEEEGGGSEGEGGEGERDRRGGRRKRRREEEGGRPYRCLYFIIPLAQ